MLTDSELIKNYLKTKDEKSLEVLIKRYIKPIYSFVYRNTGGNRDQAEDITQQVFMKVWKNLRKFDQGRSFKTWIFTIAKNSSIDYLRKKKTVSLSNFEYSLKDNKSLPDKAFEFLHFSSPVVSAIKKLSESSQKILHLRYSENLKFKEIAREIKEPINTVKSRHRRALSELKTELARIN